MNQYFFDIRNPFKNGELLREKYHIRISTSKKLHKEIYWYIDQYNLMQIQSIYWTDSLDKVLTAYPLSIELFMD